MRRMRKLLTPPWDLMGLRRVNRAPIGSHFSFMMGRKQIGLHSAVAICQRTR